MPTLLAAKPAPSAQAEAAKSPPNSTRQRPGKNSPRLFQKMAEKGSSKPGCVFKTRHDNAHMRTRGTDHLRRPVGVPDFNSSRPDRNRNPHTTQYGRYDRSNGRPEQAAVIVASSSTTQHADACFHASQSRKPYTGPKKDRTVALFSWQTLRSDRLSHGSAAITVRPAENPGLGC